MESQNPFPLITKPPNAPNNRVQGLGYNSTTVGGRLFLGGARAAVQLGVCIGSPYLGNYHYKNIYICTIKF